MSKLKSTTQEALAAVEKKNDVKAPEANLKFDKLLNTSPVNVDYVDKTLSEVGGRIRQRNTEYNTALKAYHQSEHDKKQKEQAAQNNQQGGGGSGGPAIKLVPPKPTLGAPAGPAGALGAGPTAYNFNDAKDANDWL